MTIYNLILIQLAIPFFFIAKFLGIHKEYSHIDPRMKFISAIIIAPFLETLFFQMVPILIMRRFFKTTRIILIVSATIFAIAHCTVDISRFFPAFISGILLAFTFLHWLKLSIGKAYWITFAVHLLFNIVLVIPLLILMTM